MASVYTRLTSHPPGIQHEPRRPFLHIGVKMGPHRGQVKAVIGDVRMGEGHLHGHGSLRRDRGRRGACHESRRRIPACHARERHWSPVCWIALARARQHTESDKGMEEVPGGTRMELEAGGQGVTVQGAGASTVPGRGPVPRR
jgi:hypothetical protein